ncbi:MAG: GYDIA family GHMP kinase [Salinivirgaceae bacterium]
MTQQFRSNGKLMLTGEYMALHGATTFAVPLKFGQELTIEPVAHSIIYWRTLFNGKIIFHTIFDTDQFNILQDADNEKSEWIQRVFLAIREINPKFLLNCGAEVTSTIDLPMNYGWGSSSSLIVNLCKWANVDPFAVSAKVGGGSGYDIACAQSDKPLLYSNKNNNPDTKIIEYRPTFERNMWFIFQENKINTAEAIRGFRQRKIDRNDINRINRISESWISAGTIEDIMELMKEHEEIMSHILDIPPIQKQFPDFNGQLKSLGAWGGDFMLAVSELSGADIIDYFAGKDRPTMFNWTEIVKNETHS